MGDQSAGLWSLGGQGLNPTSETHQLGAPGHLIPLCASVPIPVKWNHRVRVSGSAQMQRGMVSVEGLLGKLGFPALQRLVQAPPGPGLGVRGAPDLGRG